MTRPPVATPPPRNSRGPNSIALIVTFSAVSTLYFNYDPTPVGAEPDAGSRSTADFETQISIAPPPLPTTTSTAAEEGAEGSPQLSVARPGVLTGHMALLLNLAMVENGCHRLEKIADYTATFFKQERIGAELSDGQVMEMKIRHAPFSVYMHWLEGDKGRELLYVKGQNDGEMVVHPGGWKARLLPAIKLNPHGTVAMSESRHPVTQVGLLELSRLIAQYRKRDLEHESGVHCEVIADQEFQGRACYCFSVEYKNRKVSREYRKSVMYIDKELSLPVVVKNYAWVEDVPSADPQNLDETTLIEHYAYSDIRFEQQLADKDFDTANKDYKFRR